MSDVRNLAILLFDDAEVLDFCGPFEVFSVASNQCSSPAFNVMTVAEKSPITARNGLSINPCYTLDSCPKPDILLIPGGIGTRREITNDRLIEWIRQTATHAELVLSVCTGALLLGKAGIDMSLHVVNRLLGPDIAEATARHMEYPWNLE